MTIENLIKAVPPPSEPFWAYKGPWGAIEGEIGVTLPPDYKDYIATYGAGYFMQFMSVFLPKSWTVNLRLGAQVRLKAGSARDVLLASEEEPPYPIWPDPGGLVAFGGTDNGDELFWLTRGAPQDWPVVVWYEDSNVELFDCDMTDFLAGIVTGAIFADVFDEDWPSGEPKFEPYSNDDVRQALDDPAEAAHRLRAWRMSWTQEANGQWEGPAEDFLKKTP